MLKKSSFSLNYKKMQQSKKIIATQQNQKQKHNETLFLIFFDYPKLKTLENSLPEFSSYLKKISSSYPKELNYVASILISQKLKDEIASRLNKLQSKHKLTKTLLEIEDKNLAFQFKNQILPQLKEEIENENFNLQISLDTAIARNDFNNFNEKCYEYYASSLEIFTLDKISKTYNLISYIGNFTTIQEKNKYLEILEKKKIDYKFYTAHINYLITSIKRKKIFYLFVKDKVFATLYAPI